MEPHGPGSADAAASDSPSRATAPASPADDIGSRGSGGPGVHAVAVGDGHRHHTLVGDASSRWIAANPSAQKAIEAEARADRAAERRFDGARGPHPHRSDSRGQRVRDLLAVDDSDLASVAVPWADAAAVSASEVLPVASGADLDWMVSPPSTDAEGDSASGVAVPRASSARSLPPAASPLEASLAVPMRAADIAAGAAHAALEAARDRIFASLRRACGVLQAGASRHDAMVVGGAGADEGHATAAAGQPPLELLRQVGWLGEWLVVQTLRARLAADPRRFAGWKVQWLNEAVEAGAPCDIRLLRPRSGGSDVSDLEVARLIEVKTTTAGEGHLFPITPREVALAVHNRSSYDLWLLYGVRLERGEPAADGSEGPSARVRARILELPCAAEHMNVASAAGATDGSAGSESGLVSGCMLTVHSTSAMRGEAATAARPPV